MARLHLAVPVIALGLIALGCSAPTEPNGPAKTPVLVVTVDPGEVTVSPTRVATFTAQITRTDAPGAVALEVTDAPAGVTVSVGEMVTNGILTTAPITVSGDASASSGLYVLTLSATTPGAIPATGQFRVRVAPLVRVSFVGCATDAKALWFASQDGSGTVTQVNGINDVYTFAPEQDHAGFYYTTVNGSGEPTVHGVLQSRTELLAAPISMCEGNAATPASLTGTVTGLNSLEHVNVSLGGDPVRRTSDGQFQVKSGPEQVHDVVASKQGFLPSTPNRLLLRRDVPVATGDLGLLNMHTGGPETLVPQSSVVTLNETPDFLTREMKFHTGAGCHAAKLYDYTSNASHSTSKTFWGFPAAALRPTDWHVLTASGFFPRRSVTVAFQQVQPLAVSFGAVPNEPVVTRLEDEWDRLRAVVDVPADYRSRARLWYSSYLPNPRQVEIDASHAWLAANGYTLTTPDFRLAAGWNAAWEPTPGGFGLDWTLSITGEAPGGLCQAGLRSRSADWYGSIPY